MLPSTCIFRLISRQLLPQPCCNSLCVRGVAAAAAASPQLAAIKALRQQSGAPISEVKTALQETQWDIEAAYQVLRKKGVSAAAKKASRRASDGLIGLAQHENSIALVEVNSETDFVTKTADFAQLVLRAAAAAARLPPSAVSSSGDVIVPELLQSPAGSEGRVEEAVVACAGAVRENVQLRRAVRLDQPPRGCLGMYLHASAAPGLGRMGSVVALEYSPELKELSAAKAVQELASQLAMHVVATRPLSIDREGVPEGALESEREVLRAQALKTGKPSAVVDKMVQGKLRKFYQENVLLEQPFVLGTEPVGVVLQQLGQELDMQLRVAAFVRLQVGEGLDKETSDFAADVAQAVQSAG